MFCPLCGEPLEDDYLVSVAPDIYCCPGCKEDVTAVDEPPEALPPPPAPVEVEVDPMTYLSDFRRKYPHYPGLETRRGTCSGYPYAKANVGVVIAMYPSHSFAGQGLVEVLLGPATREDLLFFLRFPSLKTMSLEDAKAYLQREPSENP